MNIILCTCDQLRAFELGCYGNPVIRTPNVDRLAADGMRFDLAITPWPVCMAARSALLSGQYPRRCTGGGGNVAYPGRPGSFDMPEYPEHGRPHLPDPTLPELLRGAGYHTQAIGKWHLHSWPHDVGFDRYVIPRVHHAHSAQLFSEDGGPEFAAPGYSVDFEVDRVRQFLHAQRDAERPFFLYYNISPPHCPVADGPEHYTKMYDPAEVPIRPNVDLTATLPNQEHWFKIYRWDYRYYSLRLPFAEQLPEGYDLRQLIAEYYGMTTWVDDAVGAMMTSLDAAGLRDDTIVVFTSDHGDNLGSHGRVQKGSMNEESIRVPLIVALPPAMRGDPTGGTVNTEQVANLVDLMPTLLELAGQDAPQHVHGRSLASVVRGDAPATDRPWSFVETGGRICVRTPTHMLSLLLDDGVAAEAPDDFYDMRDDPYQMTNLAGGNEQADVRVDLVERLRAWHAETPGL